MSRLEDAQAALNEGRHADAIDHLTVLVDTDPAQTLSVYRVLASLLAQRTDYARAEACAAKGLARFPDDTELLNICGVALRRLNRNREAVEVLDRALRTDPRNGALRYNRANALLYGGDAPAAEQALRDMLSDHPGDPAVMRQLAASLTRQDRFDEAVALLEEVAGRDPGHVEAWMVLIDALQRSERHEQARRMCEAALSANPGEPRLLESASIAMRYRGDLAAAEAHLQSLAATCGDQAWFHRETGLVLRESRPETALAHLRRAVQLEPGREGSLTSLVHALERARNAREAEHLEEAFQLARAQLSGPGGLTAEQGRVFHEVFARICAFDELESLGSSADLGRRWAEEGLHTALLGLLPRAGDPASRLALVQNHRRWGDLTARRAAQHPIRRPPARPVGHRVRLGFLSADLRRHPVGYFAMPLFEHLDRERFEVFAYSFFRGAEDPIQAQIAGQVSAFRWWPDVSSRQAAERIAADDLDILIELGASTSMNRVEVMAYRPAPLQASWLGYPHSVGLREIDYFICDPCSRPTDPALLVETPLMMPQSWVAMGEPVFSDNDPIRNGLPQDREGRITFGTANNPNKYTRQALRAWARIVAATPGSRFAFVRPEAGAPSFRRHVEAEFAAEGVGADRLWWRAVRGGHMDLYNDIDITLDPFPLTGGTTTAEALWMGVPVVSLRGEAFHERLSWSLLSNLGLPDLVAGTVEDYHRIAIDLAADRARRAELRSGLRARIRQSPLGRTEAFARDFYDLIWSTVRAAPPRANGLR